MVYYSILAKSKNVLPVESLLRKYVDKKKTTTIVWFFLIWYLVELFNIKNNFDKEFYFIKR